MGIDVYLEWDGMPERPEIKKSGDWDSPEYKKWSEWRFGKGIYLRESYHGESYATEFLFREAFEETNDGQLWGTKMTAMLTKMFGKNGAVDKLPDPALDAPKQKMERSKEVKEVKNSEGGVAYVFPSKLLKDRLVEAVKLAIERSMKLYGSSVQDANESANEYVAFVAMLEKLESQGKNPRVVVSY